MDNKENFRKYIIISLNYNLERFKELNIKSAKELIDSCFQQVGSYFYKSIYINQYRLSQDPEIKQLCEQFNETILGFVQNHLKENKAVDEYTKQLFERSYRIAISKASDKDEEDWDKIDAPDFDFDLFDLNGFHYYLRAFKTLDIWKQELDWENKEKEFWSHEENFKQAILGYTKGWYDDKAGPWFPDHLDWWPKEFWWNDVLAYGAVVYRGKMFQDVVLYPENLDKVKILKLK